MYGPDFTFLGIPRCDLDKPETFKGAPGLLSASDELMLVTVGSDIYTSKNDGKSFRKIS